MNHITIVTLRKAISPIIAEQIQQIQQTERVNLDPKNLVILESDTPMVKKIKQQANARIELNTEQLAIHAVDMLDQSIQLENAELSSGRNHRKLAEINFAKAHKLYNARIHLLETGEALPLALELGAVNSNDIQAVTKHVASLNIPDYFTQSKKEVKAD